MSGNQRPFRDEASSYNRTGIPCGNPRRYESRGVVRMARSDPRPYKDQRLEAPVEDIETEGERQLKALVRQQLEKDVTIEGQLSRRKQFHTVNVHQPVVAGVAGALSLDDFRGLEQHDARLEELRQYGLSEDEMRLTLQAEGVGLDGKPAKRSRYGIDPSAHTAKLEEIKRKIAKKREELDKPDKFSGRRYMSRHEMELERAISHNRDKSRLLGMLMTSDRAPLESEDPDDPIHHLDSIMEEVRRKAARSRSSDGGQGHGGAVATCAPRPTGYQSKPDPTQSQTLCPLCRLPIQDSEQSQMKSDSTGPSNYPTSKTNSHSQDFSGSNSQTPNAGSGSQGNNSMCNCELNVRTSGDETSKSPERQTTEGLRCETTGPRVLDERVETIPEEVINKYKLTPDQIRELPRFKNYEPGQPSKVLYVKNLSPRVTEADLVALFVRYQRPEGPKIVFKLMTGRMKGQAFVTFPGVEEATQALNLTNGYDFRGKHIIIQYGKSQ